jgi:glycerate 2-kinase
MNCTKKAAMTLRDEAGAILRAAIGAVRPERLLTSGLDLDLAGVERIAVVGGGKAAAGMAAGLEQLLGASGLAAHDVVGLVSVPEGCGRALGRIEVRETRPVAANVPTAAALAATEEMLGLVGSLGPRDLVIAIITGGGSALLVAPAAGVTIEMKVDLARRLAASGAGIRDLNAVRQAVSRVKGGGLARACRAGRLVALVLSDVIGDSLGTIASGPCLPPTTTPRQVANILEQHAVPDRLRSDVLTAARAMSQAASASRDGSWTTPQGCQVRHLLLGSNATAVAAAAAAARGLGYEVVAAATEPPAAARAAEEVGERLALVAADLVRDAMRSGRSLAFIEGGEATVRLPKDHGRGGRNQQTVLAATHAWSRSHGAVSWPEDLLLASIGTDGEDGPTDAAGALADAAVADSLLARPARLHDALVRCDAYPLLDAAGGLIRTGPTGTNVADLRLLLIR